MVKSLAAEAAEAAGSWRQQAEVEMKKASDVERGEQGNTFSFVKGVQTIKRKKRKSDRPK